jgi:hypothetical protein
VQFYPQEQNKNIAFGGAAENSLIGKTVSWSHPSYYNNEKQYLQIPSGFHTTNFLLTDFAPYLEYETRDNTITAVKWKFISAANQNSIPPSSAQAPFKVWVRRVRFYDNNNILLHLWETTPGLNEFAAGSEPEGVIPLSSPIPFDDVRLIRFQFTDTTTSNPNRPNYAWFFHRIDGTNPRLDAQYRSRANISNGKSVYTEAKFDHVLLRVQHNNIPIAPEHTFTGVFTIKGGNYTVKDGNDNILETISGQEKTFDLNPSGIYNNNIEYQPIINGQFLRFAGAAENEGLNGQRVEWTQQMYGTSKHSLIIPNFRPTNDQRPFVPYIEYQLNSAGKITGLKWKFVSIDANGTIINTNASSPFNGRLQRIQIYDKSGNYADDVYASWETGNSLGIGTSPSGTVRLTDLNRSPIAESEISHIRFRFYDSTDPDNESLYVWTFFPPQSSVPTYPSDPIPEPDPTPTPTPTTPDNPSPEPTPEPEEPTPPTAPPTVPDNTITIVIPSPGNTGSAGQQWTIGITPAGGVPIPNNVQFYFWFIVWNTSGSNSIKASNTTTYVGPFVAKSVTDASGVTTLDIDVNNLIKPDGTKGSVPAGSYKIQFADSETGEKYVGTTPEAITTEGTAETPVSPVEPDPVEPDPVEPNPVVPVNPETPSRSSGSGGGCNTGYGIIGLLLVGIALRKYLTL